MKNRLLSFFLLCLFLLYACPKISEIIGQASLGYRNFIAAGADYEQLNGISSLYKICQEAKRVIPENSTVRISEPSNHFNLRFIKIQYCLYPLQIRANGSYFIDFDHTAQNLDSNLKAYLLPSGISVYTRPGNDFVDNGRKSPPVLKILFFFFCLTAYFIFIGYFLLKRLGLTLKERDIAWLLSTCYLLGLTGVTSIFCLYLMAGGKISFYSILGFTGTILIASYLFSVRRRGANHLRQYHGPAGPQPPSRGGRVVNLAAFSVISLTAFLIVCIPISVWDEMLIWVLRGRVFCYEKGIYFGDYAYKTNIYYPPLWPTHLSMYFSLLGDYDPVAKWVSACTFLAFIAQVRKILSLLKIKDHWCWPLIGAYILVFNHWVFFTALPENLFMAFLIGMTAAFLSSMGDDSTARSYLLLAFCMAAGLSLVKFEGFLMVLLSGLSFIILLGGIPPLTKTKRIYAGFFFLTALLPFGWMTWLRAQGNEIMVYHLQNQFSFENLKSAVVILGGFLTEGRGIFLLLFILFSLTFLYRARPWKIEEKFLLYITVLLFIFSLSAGLFWPTGDFKAYYPEVFSRLFLHLTPFAMLLWCSRCLGAAFR